MWRVKAAAHVENDHKWAERDAKAVASHKKLPHHEKKVVTLHKKLDMPKNITKASWEVDSLPPT